MAASPHVFLNTQVEMIDDHHEGMYETSFQGEAGTSATSWFSDTDDLLLRLPSRKLMSSIDSKGTGSTSTTLKKKKTIRSKTLRFRTVRMPRNANSDDILKKLKDDEVMTDEGQMTEDGKDVIRAMPVSLNGKLEVLHHLSEYQHSSSKRLKYSTWFSSGISGSWNKFKRRVNNLYFYMDLWQSAIKKVKGHFGTSVTSYFLFLKWLFLWNVFSFFLAFCFQVLPQMLYRFFQMEPRGYANNSAFVGTDFLTGKGWFEATELYYGFYTNESISITDSTAYNMSYAYFLTSGFNYLLLLAIIAYSIAKSYKINYVEAGNESTYFVTKLFCGWDYGITSRDAAALKHKSMNNELKEHLTKFKDDVKKKKLRQQCRLFFWRVFTHLIVFASIAGSGYFVFFLSSRELTSLPLLVDLIVPICISAANTFLPFIFSGIAHFEYYEHPQTHLYITMFRNMLLKVTNISMLCFYWANKVIADTKQKPKCWETFISQEIYRLVLVDFFFSLLFTLLFELFWRLLYRVKLVSKSPEFDIAANTLDLIYSQTLCWLGLFYSPLMPLMMGVKIFIIFYVKLLSVLYTCQSSKKTWHAARTHTIFLGVLLLFFVLTLATVAASIVYSEPSTECGPFKYFERAYDVVPKMVNDSEGSRGYFMKALDFIATPGFITLVLVAVGICAYYSRIVLIGHKEIVVLLKYQLRMEGHDKVFLLKLLNQVKSEKVLNSGKSR